MRIRDILSIRSIDLNITADDKDAVLQKLAGLMADSGNITDQDEFIKGIYAREKESTTCIGRGIAIPHCKSSSVSRIGLAVVRLMDGVDYASFDMKPVDLFFMIAAPENGNNDHLDVLKHLAELLMDQKIVSALRAADTPEDFLSVIDEAEGYKSEKDNLRDSSKNRDLILAVTACPTGIAHTYMAAEALKKAAKKSGILIKIETRGSGGAKSVLSEDDIRAAKAIIIAADTDVPMERFEGKKVLIVKVADGINKADVLLRRAQSKDLPIYNSKTGGNAAAIIDTAGVGHQAYRHLMSGVSHMLPFVIAGGLFGAMAYLIDTIAGYGATGGIAFGQVTPLASFFYYISELAMGLMIPVLAGYIAYSIADRPGLAAGFVGGVLAAKGNALVAMYDYQTMGPVGRFLEQSLFATDSINTVSGFIGGIVIGFLAGYLVRWLESITEALPASVSGIRPTLIYPIFGILIISLLMCFVFNPLIGFVNTVLTSLLVKIYETGLMWLVGLILGMMMAADMGGAVNKTAYLFGLSLLSAANGAAADSDPVAKAAYIAMASIMVGGMVPPLGIALACKVFPKKFSKVERASWISNIIMGCSFITEGAIPIAASDPGHVIPSIMAGSGLAGLLSALFGCTLMAPHGGIFVFATVGQPMMYIVALLAGTLVTMVMLGVVRQEKLG